MEPWRNLEFYLAPYIINFWLRDEIAQLTFIINTNGNTSILLKNFYIDNT